MENAAVPFAAFTSNFSSMPFSAPPLLGSVIRGISMALDFVAAEAPGCSPARRVCLCEVWSRLVDRWAEVFSFLRPWARRLLESKAKNDLRLEVRRAIRHRSVDPLKLPVALGKKFLRGRALRP